MIPKQDRQGVRRATDIEQKYELGGFDKAMEAAANAQKTADVATTRSNTALSVAQNAKSTADAASVQATNTQESLDALSLVVSENTLDIEGLDSRVQALEGGGGDVTIGDMLLSVYDPQGKAQDIFAYVDTAISGAIGGSY